MGKRMTFPSPLKSFWRFPRTFFQKGSWVGFGAKPHKAIPQRLFPRETLLDKAADLAAEGSGISVNGDHAIHLDGALNREKKVAG